MNKIIAIVGMCGSGKSVASEYYEKLGFKRVYFGEVTIEEIKKSGMEVNEKNEKFIRESLRKRYGMGAYATMLLPKIEKYVSEANVVLDGLYSWDELVVLNEKFKRDLYVLAIIADKKNRYNRLLERNVRPLNNDEALERDISEIENLSKAGPIAFADYYVLNNGDINQYYMELEKVTKRIMNN